MRLTRLTILCSLLAWGTSSADGQTVQLPSFRTFSYSGSVLVPDSGTASLGGNRTSASSSARRGSSRGFASQLGNSQASIDATIIDHQELDRQLLGGTPKEFLMSGRARERAVEPSAEGKALVRFARQQNQAGNSRVAFEAYKMAIEVLPADLRRLATVEFRRVFGAAADQAIRISALVRD